MQKIKVCEYFINGTKIEVGEVAWQLGRQMWSHAVEKTNVVEAVNPYIDCNGKDDLAVR